MAGPGREKDELVRWGRGTLGKGMNQSHTSERAKKEKKKKKPTKEGKGHLKGIDG